MTWRRRLATLLRRLAEWVDEPMTWAKYVVEFDDDDDDDEVFGVPGGWGG